MSEARTEQRCPECDRPLQEGSLDTGPGYSVGVYSLPGFRPTSVFNCKPCNTIFSEKFLKEVAEVETP